MIPVLNIEEYYIRSSLTELQESINATKTLYGLDELIKKLEEIHKIATIVNSTLTEYNVNNET